MRLNTVNRPVLREPIAQMLRERIENFRHQIDGFHEPLASEFRQAASHWLEIAQKQVQEAQAILTKEPSPLVFRAGDPVNRAFTNSSALIRRAVTLIEDDEPVPPGMVDAVQELGASFRLLLREFSVGRSEPQQAREQVLRAVASAGRAYATGLGLSGSVVIAQVRTTASEVIRATGLSQEQANELIREAFGDRRQDRPHPRVPRVPLSQPEKPGPDPGSAPRGNRPRRDDGPEPQEHGGRPVG